MIGPFRRHVAEHLIGEGGEPTLEEMRHLEACPECATALRRRSAFDAQLRGATRDLVTVELDAQILHVPQTTARPAGRLSLAAVPIAIAILAFVAMFGPSRDGATVGASPSPNPTSSPPAVRTLRIDCGALTHDECAGATGSEGPVRTQLWPLSDLGLLPGQVAKSDRWPVTVTFLSRTEIRIDWSDGTTTRETVEPLRMIVVTPGTDE